MNYEGTNIPVTIEITNDVLTGASLVGMHIRKPDRSLVVDTNVQIVNDNTVLYYPTAPFVKGVYKFQVHYTKNGIDYKSDIVSRRFYPKV